MYRIQSLAVERFPILDRFSPRELNSVSETPAPVAKALEPLSPDPGMDTYRDVNDLDSAGNGRPRILFLNRSYWPDAEATGQLLTDLCEDLAARFHVSVIAGQPNVNPAQTPYAARGPDRRHGVEIYRVGNLRFSKRGMLGRSLNMLSYMFGASWRSLFLARPAAVVVETDPPLLCLLGLLLRWRYRCRLIVYLQDIYPDVATALGKLREGLLARFLRAVLYSAYRRADRVVVLSRDMRGRMIDVGVDSRRLCCVPNWADTRRVYCVKTNNPFRERHALEGRFVVMYSGNLGLSQRLQNVVEAADLLRGRHEVRFVLVGDGATRPELEREVKQRHLPNIMFVDYQPQDQLAQSLSAADVHVVPLDPAVSQCLMPSKLYGVLASGTPVIALAPPESELAEIVSHNGVGLVGAPNDAQALADAVRWCLNHSQEMKQMGHAARRLAVQRFERRRSTSSFDRLLHRLVSDDRDSWLPPVQGGVACEALP